MPASRTKHLTEAATTFNRSLGDDVRAYLETRGIAAQADGHALGEVPQDCDPEWSQYRGMLSIPFIAPDNKVVNIRFRNLRDGGPKYLQLGGVTPGPYNVRVLAKGPDTVVITEGEIEALTLAELGIAAVGIPGVHLWKSHYARLFDGVSNVIVWGDPDDAGRDFNAAVQKSIPRALAAYMEKDINDTYVQDGPMPILAAFSKAGGSP